MKINIYGQDPAFFTTMFAQVLKNWGTVNVLSHGEYRTLLFDGSDYEQERDGVLYNSEKSTDYEVAINPIDAGEQDDIDIVLVSRLTVAMLAELKTEVPRNTTVYVVNEPLEDMLEPSFNLCLRLLELEKDYTKYFNVPMTLNDYQKYLRFGEGIYKVSSMSNKYVKGMYKLIEDFCGRVEKKSNKLGKLR